ncbi:iron-sulfur cluster-binding protein like protein [Gloeothece citriformis PCC 7424]|uniref:Iron-sulfur cluster-binding protein like protein n=1 Tax=Gloeothece citriformis (strain PCC 7424) TaxID=65393 RepID=B7KI87_GLOC7|nr:(2Fe-2S) ferredoxin domain-containing protein [Gloeothece citriformis]ACK73574.1 iron-sulfur cluster-binding protein like protein [Gloeothece citriformis PCC 7424]
MSNCKQEYTNFNAVGQLLDFIIKDGYKIKYLRVNIENREYWIKLPKDLRQDLDPAIMPGCWVEVNGFGKLCSKTGKLKLKAEEVRPTSAEQVKEPCPKVEECNKAKTKKATASILVCQKSDCWKKGGKAMCQAIETCLRDNGLTDKVQVKLTGCLKRCSKGPNMVVLPDKTNYTRVRPDEIPILLEKHFAITD